MKENSRTKEIYGRKRDKIVFATFFPACENTHLTKEVGMIPYILHRDFGYDSYIICYKNGDYPHLETKVLVRMA